MKNFIIIILLICLSFAAHTINSLRYDLALDEWVIKTVAIDFKAERALLSRCRMSKEVK